MTKTLLHRNVQPSELETMSPPSDKREPQNNFLQESSRRAGDSSLGRPDTSLRKTIVDDAQFTPVSTTDDSNCEEDINELESSSFFAPVWICRVLRTCLLFLSAVAVFFIVTQTASFLSNIRNLSLIEKSVLSSFLIIFGLIIVWIIVRMIALFFKLRVSPQIKIKALQELENRKKMRKYSLKKNKEAIQKLSSFLKDSFLINDKKLSSLGFSHEDISALNRNKALLIKESENLSGTTQDWIDDFRQKIQNPLDRVAIKRIRNYSLNAGIMAGISPFPLIDRLIVFSACLSMLKDLLEIYSLKPSWDKNLVLMGQVIINTYLAGVIEDVTEAGIDGISNLAEDAAEKIPDFALRGAGKATETAMHGYMVYRLGKAAIKVLHPISVSNDQSIASALISKISMS